MKTRALLKLISLLLVGLCVGSSNAWARLPKPIQAEVKILAIDLETQTLVIKTAPRRKPFILDWNKDTEFKRDNQLVSAGDLKQNTSVLIEYRQVSFRNPLLKKVIWTEQK